VPLVIDETALSEDGVDSNVPISISIGTIPTVKSKTPKPNQQPKPIVQNSPTAIPLGDALNIMLQDLELNYYVKEGILHITSQNMHDEFCITRIYDVRSLFARGITPESLQSAIQNTTSGPWQDVDGTGGEFALVDNVLTVRQSYHGQPRSWQSVTNPGGGTLRVISLGRMINKPVSDDKTSEPENKNNTTTTFQTTDREQDRVLQADHDIRVAQHFIRGGNTLPPSALFQ
jgi:hypothetical protein